MPRKKKNDETLMEIDLEALATPNETDVELTDMTDFSNIPEEEQKKLRDDYYDPDAEDIDAFMAQFNGII